MTILTVTVLLLLPLRETSLNSGQWARQPTAVQAMIALNAAVARQLVKFKKEVDIDYKKGKNKDEAIFQVLKKTIISILKMSFLKEIITAWNGIRKLRKEVYQILSVFRNQ